MNINPFFILPNLFTAGSIFAGMLCLIFASKGQFSTACYLVLVSMFLDGLDGRVARLTGTSSKFGVELDSLADIVVFGVAPAMLLYFYTGEHYGRYGIAISAIFVVLGAIRLARFNITSNDEPNYFIGLPIPSAAVILVFWILFDIQYKLLVHKHLGFVLLVLTFILGILMVSNIRYLSFKKMKWSIKTFVVLLLVLVAAYLRPVEVIGGIMSAYMLYGVVRFLFICTTKILFRKRHCQKD